jgi:hypothetical protein
MCNPIAYDVLFICKQIVCLLLATIKVNPIFNRCHLRRWNDRSRDKESENYLGLQGIGFTLLYCLQGLRRTACYKNCNFKGSSRRKYVYRISISITEVGLHSTFVYVRSFMFYRQNLNVKYTWYVCFPVIFLMILVHHLYFLVSRDLLISYKGCVWTFLHVKSIGILARSLKFQNVTVDRFYIIKLCMVFFKVNERFWRILVMCISRPNAKDNYNKMATTINCNYLHGLWHWQSLDKIRNVSISYHLIDRCRL